MENTKLLNIDWLTLSCSGGLHTTDPNVVVERLYLDNGDPQTTRQYGNLSKIYYKKQLVAISESEPHSKIIPPDSVRLKIENRLLYLRNAKNIVQNLLDSFKLRFKQVSRIDIAMDFQQFDNRVKPENLIRKYLANEYVRVGKGKFKVMGAEKTVKHQLQYVQLGSRSTGKHMKMYNKTIELKETKDKRYIRDLWEMAGFGGKPVWRLELSITSNQQKATDTMTGELKEASLFRLFSPAFLEELFMAGVNTLFSIRIINGGKNISRMKELPLFKNTEFSNLRLTKTVDAPNSTRHNKGVISDLIKNLHYVPKHNFNLLQELVNSIWHYATVHALWDYALKQVDYYYPEENELLLRAFKIAADERVTDIDVEFTSLRQNGILSDVQQQK